MKSNLNAQGFAYVSAFEVLAQPLVPGVPNVPYVTQGYFFQASNLTSISASFTLYFVASTAWQPSGGGAAVAINTIDQNGNVTPIPFATFISTGGDPVVGGVPLTVPAFQTVLVGVQLIQTTSQNLAGTTPQDGASYRGYTSLAADSGSAWMALATHRQVFTNFNADGSTSLSEAAYSVPIVNGPQISIQ